MIVGLGCEKLQPELLLPEGMNADDEIMRMQDEGLTGFGEIVENIVADGRTHASRYEPAAPRNLPGVGAGGRHAMRRQRCVLGVPRSWVLLPIFGPRRRHRDVFRSYGSTRRHPPLTPRAASQDVADALVREMAW